MTDVTMNRAEYEHMQRQIAKLNALEAGGVDNWEWYDESLTEWRKENEIDELIDETGSDFDDLLVDAEVDEPGGSGCGYYIRVDSASLGNILRTFGDAYHEIQSRK